MQYLWRLTTNPDHFIIYEAPCAINSTKKIWNCGEREGEGGALEPIHRKLGFDVPFKLHIAVESSQGGFVTKNSDWELQGAPRREDGVIKKQGMLDAIPQLRGGKAKSFLTPFIYIIMSPFSSQSQENIVIGIRHHGKIGEGKATRILALQALLTWGSANQEESDRELLAAEDKREPWLAERKRDPCRQGGEACGSCDKDLTREDAL